MWRAARPVSVRRGQWAAARCVRWGQCWARADTRASLQTPGDSGSIRLVASKQNHDRFAAISKEFEQWNNLEYN